MEVLLRPQGPSDLHGAVAVGPPPPRLHHLAAALPVLPAAATGAALLPAHLPSPAAPQVRQTQLKVPSFIKAKRSPLTDAPGEHSQLVLTCSEKHNLSLLFPSTMKQSITVKHLKSPERFIVFKLKCERTISQS